LARKSRKQNDMPKPVAIDSLFTSVGAYVRLSAKYRSDKGDSIEMQKQMIRRYIEENVGLNLYAFYIDNGWSGTTDERPEFQRMLEDAENGIIQCIITKDTSRFGRNMIDAGYYIEKFLPSIGVRFISVADNYDSAKSNNDIHFALKNLLNEAYALDISRKVKVALNANIENGRYIGGRPPFGYIKASDNCHKLIVDEPAAVVVRQIFQLAEQGKKSSSIARMLNSANILAPGNYRFSQGMISKNLVGKGKWTSSATSRILDNEVYIGNLVQGKTKTKNHRQKSVAPENWVRVENTHEPIVSKELFEKVYELRHSARLKVRKQHDTYSLNMFKGKIFCAHCGSSLERKKSQKRYIYRCTVGYVASDACHGHSISEEKIIEIISNLFVQYSEALADKIAAQADENLNQSELVWLQLEMSNCEKMTKHLYENFVDGTVDATEYIELKERYRQKTEQYTQRRSELMLEQTERKIELLHLQELQRLVSGFKESMQLTAELVDNIVDSIGVMRDGRVFVRFKDI